MDPTKKANHTQKGCFGSTLSATTRKKLDAIIVEHNLSYDNAETRMVETFIDSRPVVLRYWQFSSSKKSLQQMLKAASRHIAKRYSELGYSSSDIHNAYCVAQEFIARK